MKRTKSMLALAVVLAVMVFAAGFYLGRGIGDGETPPPKTERKILYWHDPMVPGARFDKPGKSPFMDMQLVPVYANAAAIDGSVRINPTVINNLGIRTHTVRAMALTRSARADGFLYRESGGALFALVDVFGRDVGWIRAGLAAEVRVMELAGRSYTGTVAAIVPDVDIGRRALKLRIRLRETDVELSPNMIATVTIRDQNGANVLAVPSEAVIREKQRSTVILDLGDSRFKPVEVSIGSEFDGWIEIRAGLKAGDRVVTSGQFLIDSEANLRGALQRLTPPAGTGEKEPKP